MSSVEAVIFDLDGVLIDSEHVWDEARREVTGELGGVWRDEATRAMMGMSSVEWSTYMHEALHIPLPPEAINRRVVERMEAIYRKELPLFPGAREAVERMAAKWPLGLASSSNRELIDYVLEAADLQGNFRVTVSSEEVERGKPGPDVYLEAAWRMGVEPSACVAIEDSGNGIRAGKAAGMRVIVIPNMVLPPEPEALALADALVGSLEGLSVDTVDQAASGG
ncbi:MAG: HAD family phosphatase [Gaiellales bacterium]|nr:MAG: HAD family phosphatase [Gaiellales bacterium]